MQKKEYGSLIFTRACHFAYDFRPFHVRLEYSSVVFYQFLSSNDGRNVQLVGIGLRFLYKRIPHRLSLYFATLFLLITGISCTLTHSNVIRATRLLIFAVILTLATAFVDTVSNMGALIIFGIIHCMAVSIFVYAAIDKIFKDDVFLLAFGAAFIVAGILIPWYDMPFINLPEEPRVSLLPLRRYSDW